VKYHTRSGGFSLIELLIALSLMAVVALLSFRLLGANFHLTAAARTANDNAASFDDAVRQLRAEVSASSSLEMPEPNVLRIATTGNPSTEWRSDRGILSRKIPGADRRWNVGHPISLKLDGAVLLLSADSAEPTAMASMHLPPPRGRP
jgi:prepilin-type N-terminal cleavage/methylation domain-containing protein